MMEDNVKKKNVYKCITDHFAVQQKLTEHCKSNIIKFLKSNLTNVKKINKLLLLKENGPEKQDIAPKQKKRKRKKNIIKPNDCSSL